MKKLSVLFALILLLATPILAQDNIFAPDKNRVIDTVAYYQWHLTNAGDTAQDSFDYQFNLQANRLKFEALVAGYTETSIDQQLSDLKKAIKSRSVLSGTNIPFVLVIDTNIVSWKRQLFAAQVLSASEREPLIMSFVVKNLYVLPPKSIFVLSNITFIDLEKAVLKNFADRLKFYTRYIPPKIKHIIKSGIGVWFKIKDGWKSDTLWGQDWCPEVTSFGFRYHCVPNWARKYFDDKKRYNIFGPVRVIKDSIIKPFKLDTIRTEWAPLSSEIASINYIKDNQIAVYIALFWHFKEAMKGKKLCFLKSDNENLNETPFFCLNDNLHILGIISSTYNDYTSLNDLKKLQVVRGEVIEMD